MVLYLYALVCIVASPLLLLELKNGPRWREERRVRIVETEEDTEMRR